MSTTPTSPTPSEQARRFRELSPKTDPGMTLDEERLNTAAHFRAVCGTGEEVASVAELVVHDVGGKLYRPRDDHSRLLIWIHGGGWTVGDPDCYDAAARALANRAKCSVLSVNYRLAPEHPYPAAIEDCWRATEWALASYDHVAVGGDSAGGNLAAAVALRARDRGENLAFQLLVYPLVDSEAADGEFCAEYAERYEHFDGEDGYGATSREGLRSIWEVYVPDALRRTEADASPMHASSLVGLAPAMVITAEHDMLRGENERYVSRLRRDGVTVELVTFEGQVHGFFHALGLLDDARKAVDRAGKALLTAFELSELPPSRSSQ